MTDSVPAPRPIAARIGDIAPFRVMELLARARELERQGRDIVHMEIGEPDFESPPQVVAAANAALAAGFTHYTPALGLPALREAIADFYRRRYRVDVDPRRIVITPGASGALLLALGTVLDRDRELLLADPGYPCNRHFARFVEGKPRAIPVSAETRYQLTAELVATHWGPATSAVLAATPSNPTGTVLDPSELERLAQETRSRGGMLIVDEIYHGLTYGFDATTALSVSDELFVVNSFSKYFCMTGWRLGWLVAPEEYVRAVEKLAQNLFIAAPTLAQYAAIAALQPDCLEFLEQRRAEFATRRDYLLPALRELGFVVACEPQGAFYIYADCSGFGIDAEELAHTLLEEAGVAVTPGIDFGENNARSHLRFAYTTTRSRLEEGVARIADFLRRRGLRAG